MRRELLPSYAIVVVGLLGGMLVGGVLTDAEPAALGWLLGAGVGLTAGAFVAAILAGVPLAGGRGATAPPGEGRLPDPLAHLRASARAAAPADEPPEPPEEEARVGLAGLGRRGNGRAL